MAKESLLSRLRNKSTNVSDQEEKLRKKYRFKKKIMSIAEIKRFIMFYERITLQMLKDLVKSASIVITLNTKHEIKRLIFKK